MTDPLRSWINLLAGEYPVTDKIREVAEWAGDWTFEPSIQEWHKPPYFMADKYGLTPAGSEALIEKLQHPPYKRSICMTTQKEFAQAGYQGWWKVTISESDRSSKTFGAAAKTRPEAVLEAVWQCVEAMK